MVVGARMLKPESFSCSLPKDPRAQTRKQDAIKYNESRGRLDPQDRGHERDPLGLERLSRHRLHPRREGVRLGRGVEEQAARVRLPLRPRGRDIPQAQLGKRLGERGGDGGHRRQRRRLPRGHRRRGGVHRVLGVLA